MLKGAQPPKPIERAVPGFRATEALVNANEKPREKLNINYNLTLKRSASHTIVGKAKTKTGWEKKLGEKGGTPGPGHYHPVLKSSASSYSLTGKNRYQYERDLTPGPGAYEVEDKVSVYKSKPPSYTMRGRPKTRYNGSVNPSPAAYKPKYTAVQRSIAKPVTIKGCHSYGFDIDETPGPAAYDCEQAIKMLKQRAPMHKIGLKTKIMWDKQNDPSEPGPGSYDAPEYMGRGMAKSISLASLDMVQREREAVPGPGHYPVHIRKKHNQGPAYTMGVKHKAYPVGGDAPGPGKYKYDFAVVKAKAPAHRIAHRNTKKIKKRDSVPGCTLYQEFKSTAPKWTIRPRRRIKEMKDDVPGPGHYSHETQLKFLKKGPKGRSISFRNTKLRSRASQAPGPGKYNVKYEFASKKTPSASLKGGGRDAPVYLRLR